MNRKEFACAGLEKAGERAPGLIYDLKRVLESLNTAMEISDS